MFFKFAKLLLSFYLSGSAGPFSGKSDSISSKACLYLTLPGSDISNKVLQKSAPISFEVKSESYLQVVDREVRVLEHSD